MLAVEGFFLCLFFDDVFEILQSQGRPSIELKVVQGMCVVKLNGSAVAVNSWFKNRRINLYPQVNLLVHFIPMRNTRTSKSVGVV